MQYLGVSDCKLQEGSMRADVNLSVREVGSETFGTRTEMKNLNSFKAIARAIEGERERQIELLEEGRAVVQETRRWDDNKESSHAMRSKEDARITVTSRTRIFRRSTFPMHGSKSCVPPFRSFVKPRWSVIRRSMSFRLMMQGS